MADGIRTLAVPCSCVGLCGAVVVTEIEQFKDDPEALIVTFTHTYQGGLRDRVRAALRVIRGRDPWLHSLVFHGKQIDQLRDAFRG